MWIHVMMGEASYSEEEIQEAYGAAIGVWLKKWKGLVETYQICNFVLLTLMLLTWWACPQSVNPAILPLVLADMCRAAVTVRLYRKSYTE